jgi:hypothetical protein
MKNNRIIRVVVKISYLEFLHLRMNYPFHVVKVQYYPGEAQESMIGVIGASKVGIAHLVNIDTIAQAL